MFKVNKLFDRKYCEYICTFSVRGYTNLSRVLEMSIDNFVSFDLVARITKYTPRGDQCLRR